MTATSSVSSNALNFTSAVQSAVDPRTGLYGFGITLPEIQTNDLRGPGFGPTLTYSALNTSDSGYGYGWDVALSQYAIGTKILSLSTGETFKVTGSDSNSGQLTMEEKRLDSFHFYQDSETVYRVMHKSGLVEILEVQGSAQNRVAMPKYMCSPTGHKITLGYRIFTSAHPMLAWVKDDSGNTLMTIDRDSTSVTVVLQPNGAPGGGPLASFVMTLTGSAKYVTRISLPGDLGSWRCEYNLVNDHLCMIAMESPSGVREEMEYKDLGHLFPPSSGRKNLPRVTRHLTKPGFNQPPIDVRYTYKRDAPGSNETNFLGAFTTFPYENDGLDQLYKLRDYEYATLETLWVDDQPKRKIERVFNGFHLLTRQSTTQNNNVETIETTYHLIPGVPFDQQPRNCQMPASVRTTWSQLDNPNKRRSQTVSTTFDNFGNLRTVTQANGVVETNVWYSAAGEDGSPADPEKFVRQLKEKTITPAPSANGHAPTLRTRYRYKTMSPLEGSSREEDWITLESEVLVEVVNGQEIELERHLYEHYEDSSDAFLHGQVKRHTVTLNKKSTCIAYRYCKFINSTFNTWVRETQETLSTDFDTFSRATLQQHSLLTSQVLMSSADGVETHFYYDFMGRPTSEVVARGTAFEARRQYQYILSTQHGLQAEYISINAKNVKTRSVMDGLGRLIYQERDHVDEKNPSLSCQTHAAVYDAWGKLVEQTEFDWLDGVALPLKSRFFHDDWAQQCCVIGPTGVEAHQRNDPIGTPESKGPVHRSWIQSAGPQPCISGLSESWINLFGKPTQICRLDAAEKVIATDTYLYDGLGRTTQHSNPLTLVTQYAYDARSRMVKSTLPDNNVVTRSYADHSAEALAVEVSVNINGTDVIRMGERKYDGLGRMTSNTTGSRTERYAYEGDRLQVKTRTTPGNVAIDYDYNLALTDQPTNTRAPDEQASFFYDPISARLTEANNEQGKRKYGYNAANQLNSESWVDKQGDWENLYANSMQGRLLKRTDLQQAGSGGLDTVYTYDASGRAKTILQGQIEATFDYNTLGQLCKTTTQDLSAKTTMVTDLTYDDQGQETKRTLSLTGQSVRIQEQAWQPDGLLKSRHLHQDGVTLLMELFEYDPRGRLSKHECTGSTLPRDSEGREFKKQQYLFDPMDNLKMVLTTFPDDKIERAIFTYDKLDPCQLISIAYTPPRPTGDPTFTYNLNGCQLNDERGQSLIYDTQNRLLDVESASGQIVSQYRYDSHDHLVTSQHGDESPALRFYQGEQLSTVLQDGRQTRLLHHADQPLGQQVAGDSSQTLLLQTDATHNVIAESQQNDLRTAVYSAYGERHSDKPMFSLRAFKGEVREAGDWYLLGRGYRPYHPALQRFFSPDALSPFGSGGLNPYCYCLGNPIALRDPTGQTAIGYSGRPVRPDEDAVPGRRGGGSDWTAWLWVGVGVVATIIGVAMTIATAGAAMPLAGTAFAYTVAQATSMGIATALGLAGTAASAVQAATGDEVAGELVKWFGIAALPFVVSGAAFGAYNGLMRNIANSAWQEMLDDMAIRFPKNSAGSAASLTRDMVVFKAQTFQSSMSAGTQPSPTSASIGAQADFVDDVIAPIASTSKSAVTSAPRPGISVDALKAVRLKAPPPPPKPLAPKLDQLKMATERFAASGKVGASVKTANAEASTSAVLANSNQRAADHAITTGKVYIRK